MSFSNRFRLAVCGALVVSLAGCGGGTGGGLFSGLFGRGAPAAPLSEDDQAKLENLNEAMSREERASVRAGSPR
jgi:hypothetical protein